MAETYPYHHMARVDVARFLPAPSNRCKVLEIGCGYGAFRENLPADCEYWGIEPAPAAAQIAAQHLDKVVTGIFTDAAPNVPDRYFDCIVCNDVIEHMDDVDGFLQAVKSKLVPGGVIVGSIPNVRFVQNLVNLMVLRDWKYVDTGILDRTHLRFFTEKSLRRLFLENGYSIDLLDGINPIAIKGKSIPVALRNLAALLLSCLLGADSKYVQFGFRVRPVTQPGE